jgi:hypothetical protein
MLWKCEYCKLLQEELYCLRLMEVEIVFGDNQQPRQPQLHQFIKVLNANGCENICCHPLRLRKSFMLPVVRGIQKMLRTIPIYFWTSLVW